MPEETTEIRVPLTVSVGEREIEIPVMVPVPLAALAEMVQRHLDSGAELHGLLLEFYADHVNPQAQPLPVPKPARSSTDGARRRKRPPAETVEAVASDDGGQ